MPTVPHFLEPKVETPSSNAPISINVNVPSMPEVVLAQIKSNTDNLDVPISEMGGGGSSAGVTDAQLRASPIQIVGGVSISNLPATQQISGIVALDSTTLTALENVNVVLDADSLANLESITVQNNVTTDMTDRTGRELGVISGNVSVDNFPSSQVVSGTVSVTNLPSSQNVVGPLTDEELRVSPVPVTGQFYPATQPISGTIAVSNLPPTQPVSGTVAVSNLPSTQNVSVTNFPTATEIANDIGNPVPISGSVAVSNLPSTQSVSGTVAVSNPTANPETGLAKDATFTKDADGGIKAHIQNLPATQPVSGTVSVGNFPTTQTVAGSVSVSNFPASTEVSNDVGNPVPVSGTVAVSNLPVTQAVSGSVSVSNFPASTEIVNDVGNPVPINGTVSIGNFPATQAVSIAAMPSTPVTGAFWQATQPVSLATNAPDVTDRAARLLGHVAVDSAPTTAVTGTFWQATQPISGTVTANAGTGTQAVSLVALPALVAGAANIGDVDVLTLPALPAGANTIGTTLGPALTKGTQGATGYGVQQLRDAGRVLFAATVSVAPTVSEVLLTMIPNRAGVAGAGITTIPVTPGKTMRITRISVAVQNSATVAAAGLARLRMNPAGACVLGSPLLLSVAAASNNLIANGMGFNDITIEEGVEFSGTMQIGVTLIGVATGTAHISLSGYEY